MSNFSEEALSVVVSRFESMAKKYMFEINTMLSESSQSEIFVEVLEDKIVKFTLAEQSLNNAKILFKQSLAARIQRIKDHQESVDNQKKRNYEIQFPD